MMIIDCLCCNGKGNLIIEEFHFSDIGHCYIGTCANCGFNTSPCKTSETVAVWHYIDKSSEYGFDKLEREEIEEKLGESEIQEIVDFDKVNYEEIRNKMKR